MKGRGRLYFSFRSPFSWMAIETLRRAEDGWLDRLEWLPYWDPDPQTMKALEAEDAGVHYVQMSKAKHLYILQDTKRQAARLELPMRWPIDVNPWWEVPHLGWLLARRMGRATAFYDAVMRARWHRGENVCEEAGIRRVAAEADLDPDLVAGAVHDPQVRAEGVACLVRAWHDDVFGIPYFLVGRHRFWGIDRALDFLAAYRAAADPQPQRPDPPPEPAAADAVGAYDCDTAGGCG